MASSFWNAPRAGEQARLLSKLHSPAGSKASPILLGKLSSGLPTLRKSTSSHEGKLKIQPSLPRAVRTSAPNLKCGWKEKPLEIHVTVRGAMTSKVQASRGLDIAITDLLKHPSLRKRLGLEIRRPEPQSTQTFSSSSKFKAEGRRLTSLPYFSLDGCTWCQATDRTALVDVPVLDTTAAFHLWELHSRMTLGVCSRFSASD